MSVVHEYYFFRFTEKYVLLSRDYAVVPLPTVDIEQFWSLQMEKCLKNIRHDFELLYGTVYGEMTMYYETKLQEMQTTVEQELHYQNIVAEQLTISQQQLQLEYEEVQKSLSYENETFIKLKETFCK